MGDLHGKSEKTRGNSLWFFRIIDLILNILKGKALTAEYITNLVGKPTNHVNPLQIPHTSVFLCIKKKLSKIITISHFRFRLSLACKSQNYLERHRSISQFLHQKNFN